MILQIVRWAADAVGASVQHVGVDHGGPDIAMSQQFLNRTDVLATFE